MQFNRGYVKRISVGTNCTRNQSYVKLWRFLTATSAQVHKYALFRLHLAIANYFIMISYYQNRTKIEWETILYYPVLVISLKKSRLINQSSFIHTPMGTTIIQWFSLRNLFYTKIFLKWVTVSRKSKFYAQWTRNQNCEILLGLKLN